MGNSSLTFQVKTGVRQGYVISTVLFNLLIDWEMRHTTEDQQRGIRWTLFDTLGDLDFVEDFTRLSHASTHAR